MPWANNVYFPSTDAFYWNNINYLATSPASKCVTASSYSTSLYSDIADGAFVEKGAAAEVLRKGNDPTAASPSWSFNRNMYTLDSSNALVAYTDGITSLTTNAFHFIQGKDVDGDCSATTAPCAHTALSNWTASTDIMRPSVHGDVVHSRPLPVNYGTTANPNAGVTAYYGANDGTFHAVVASGANAGKELWAFTAPEFSNKAASRSPSSSTDPLTRLMNNSPLVNYANVDPALNPLPKDYFFDGSTGIFQNVNNTQVWIYPSMRRGGRMIYSFDVTNSNPSVSSANPVALKWRAGCTFLSSGSDPGDCTDGTGSNASIMANIGQTWSTPSPVPIKKLDGTTLTAVVFGGGYDNCEDADTASPSCGSGKGHVVYVLDADTGAVIKSFTTLRSVIADVSFVDVDNDNHVDYGYVLDTGGNVYRINFSDPANNVPLGSANWTIQRIAYTSGGGRKFQWTPGLLPSGGKVYMAFASGDREHPLITNYPYTTQVTNRLYVYLDDMVSTNTNLDDTNTMSNFSAPTTCDTAGIGSTGNTNKGWFMDFPYSVSPYGGEQAVTSAVIAGGMVTVSTNRPIPPVTGTCSTALGEARGYWVNLYNASGAMNVAGNCGGDRSGIFAGGGLPPSPVIGTVPIDGVPTTVLIGAIQRQGGASSPIAPQKLRPTIPSIRKPRYWKNSGDN
jgi:Tfp pilus tip-associated adhesin PilY1